MLQCGKSKYKLKGNTDVFEKNYMMYSRLKNIAKKSYLKKYFETNQKYKFKQKF